MSHPSIIVAFSCTDLPKGNARQVCAKCPSVNGYLARYIKTNGYVAIRWVCDWCESYTTAGDLPTTVLPNGVRPDDLPLRVDNRDEDGEPCAVCGSSNVEYHHWAPYAIFPDWNETPGVFLCPMHHQEWHHRMRAHGLRWPHELATAS